MSLVMSNEDAGVPLMGTLEAKFLSNNNKQAKNEQQQEGVQFPKLKPNKTKQQHQQPSQSKQVQKQPQSKIQQLQQKFQKQQQAQKQQTNDHASEVLKKKKKKKKKPQQTVVAPLPFPPQTPSASAKKKVSFSPGVVSTVAYTYSKQEYDRTPIMGIFNHFCDSCQEAIEGARFHCNLCPASFDMCQTCFVTQAARHIHGQAAFSCPELDEIEALEDEGDDEGDEGDYDILQEYLASLSAEGLINDEGDFPFGFPGEDEGEDEDEDDLVAVPEPSVRLADENGPLERITSAQAASLKASELEDVPLKQLFPKAASAGAAAATASDTVAASGPTAKLFKKSQQKSSSSSKESKALKPELSQSPSKTTKGVIETPSKQAVSKSKKISQNGAPSNQSPTKKPKSKEEQPISKAVLSNAPSAKPSTSPQKTQSGNSSNKPKAQISTKVQDRKASVLPISQTQASVAVPTSKKRARMDGSAPKVKKQKLTSSPKSGSDIKFSFE